MKMKLEPNQILWIISLLLLGTATHLCNTYQLEAPVILPTTSDITLEVYSNVTLECQSNSPIKWKTSDLADAMLNYNEDNISPDSNQLYKSYLTLYNVTAEYVQYYYCIHEDVELTGDFDTVDELEDLISKFKASRIYVFVNDLHNLLVPHSSPIILADHYSDVIVPCKPTSKDIDVEITNSFNETFSSETFGKFDAKLGFVIKFQHITNEGMYICRPKHPSNMNPYEEIIYIVQNVVDCELNNSNCIDNYMVMVNSNNDNDNYITTNLPSITPTDMNINNSRVFSGKKMGFNNNFKREMFIPYIASSPASSPDKKLKPNITSSNNGHAWEGEDFYMDCIVQTRLGVKVNTTWETPNNYAIKENRFNIKTTTSDSTNGTKINKSTITIYNISKSKDDGYYKCTIIDHFNNVHFSKYYIKILNKNEAYIDLFEPTNHTIITIPANTKKIRLNAKLKGYPEPTFLWYNNNNLSFPHTMTNEKYTVEISKGDHNVDFYIKNVTFEDTGNYILYATNGFVEKTLKYQVFVKDSPKVRINDVYIQAGAEARVLCESHAFPQAIITWKFTSCKIKPKWPTCENKSRLFEENEFIVHKDNIYQKSELIFTPSEPGIISCIAKNTIGTTTGQANIIIGDLTDPVVVYGISDTLKIGFGDEVSLTCGALAYNYSANLFWYRQNVLIENSSNVAILSSHTNYSYRTTLMFKNIQYTDSGLYECRAHGIDDDGFYESKSIDLKVYDPFPPIMDTTNMDTAEIEKNLGDSLTLECKASGIPKPVVSWFKNDNPLYATISDYTLTIEEDGTLLKIPFIKPEDEGIYKCHVSNRLGIIEKISQVRIANLPRVKLDWIIALSVAFLILLLFIIYLCVKISKEKMLRKELKAAGLANFVEGAVECINPALSLDEQADLLPYDRRFEFPKNKLKLGKQLGAGAFGVVLKAVAEEILPDEKETTVAVKMVKRTADNEVIRALVSELKIMVHLGQHLNVVNLLGAVTKDITKREIMIIVEYCRYGNLQNFLLKNRKHFINQINPDTDEINPNITTREQKCSNDYEYNSKSEANSLNNTQGYVRQSELDYISNNMDSCNTEQTLISADGDVVLSNNSIQPVWRTNYKPDCTTPMDITTTHLVSWAFQIARGMDYLASRKVLHGDLAARNILLCDDHVVKICDFGLARTMYKNDNYKKQGKAPLPIKWLAIESLGDQIFSTYSDVWSFGIVLWEIFSLAKVPYPGMEADQTLYIKLKSGYRMEKPEFANQSLYDIMLECWSVNPESRPLFNILEKRLAKMLEDDVRNHYIDLNEPYLKMNTQLYKDGQTDYLVLMGCPDEPAPSAPRYVNGHILPETCGSNSQHFGSTPFNSQLENDYLTFPEPSSPTLSNNLNSPMSKNRKKVGLPEEIPMLRHPYYDSEAEISPEPTTSRNFSKLNTPKMDNIEYQEREIDSHFNKLPNDERIKDDANDAVSNPSYLMLQTINEIKR